MATSKEQPSTSTAVAEQEPAAAPQTQQEIAKTEEALGLRTEQRGAPPARAAVRMGIAPTTLDEGWRMAQFFAQSELVPKGYRGRPADVLVAIQYGMEVGLPPAAALHSIYVTNGRPSLWGDGFLAVIMAAPSYKDHHEYYVVDGVEKEFLVAADLAKDDTMAVCSFWRRDSARPRTATFSIAKAKKAGLWTKQGPWADYPDRMLKMRARGFAGHDAFPDVLRGIKTAEEVIDLPAVVEEVEAPREVRRISESGVSSSGLRSVPTDGAPPPKTDAPPKTDVVLGPVGVQDVQEFLGGYCVILDSGDQVEIPAPNGLDAVELEKFKGTKNKVRLTCHKRVDGTFELRSFGIAD